MQEIIAIRDLKTFKKQVWEMQSIYFLLSKESHKEIFVKWISQLIAFKIVNQKKKEFLTRRRLHGIKRKML